MNSKNESIDPLDYFNAITDKKAHAHDPDPEAFPGKTPPRNRGNNAQAVHSWLDTLPFQEYLVGGVPKRFYTIGALAQALNRKPVTIRSWESKGWIPPASFRTPPPKSSQLPERPSKGRRLYSESQIVFLVEASMVFDISGLNPNWEGFRDHINQHYPNH